MSSEKVQYKDIGGQAVMEGVMMQSPSDESIAIAVRRPNGKIMVTCSHREPLSKKHKWMGLPLIRGCVNMVVMLKMGMETLDKSTQMLGVMDEEPSKFEKWLADKLGASIDKVVMAVAMVLAGRHEYVSVRSAALRHGDAHRQGDGQPPAHQPVRRLDAHCDSDRLYVRHLLCAGYQARVHVSWRGT